MKRPQDELLKYAEIDATEWGETMELLVQLSNRLDHVSDDLANLVRKEVNDCLEYAKSNSEIVETTSTKTYTYKELVWK